MGGACSAHGGNEKCVQNFWLKSLKGSDHSEYENLNGVCGTP
jgi:hypothetical protein